MNTTTEIIHQKLLVKPWPLLKIGDEKFFGYVVSMGIFPRDWGDSDGMFVYADFAYNDSYERYLIPNDEDLKEQLHDMLWSNLNGPAGPGDIYGKVWIFLTPHGYLVQMP